MLIFKNMHVLIKIRYTNKGKCVTKNQRGNIQWNFITYNIN